MLKIVVSGVYLKNTTFITKRLKLKPIGLIVPFLIASERYFGIQNGYIAQKFFDVFGQHF